MFCGFIDKITDLLWLLLSVTPIQTLYYHIRNIPWLSKLCSINKNVYENSGKPGVLFMEHWQKVQNQKAAWDFAI